MGVQLGLALGVFCMVYERFCMGVTLWAMLSVRYICPNYMRKWYQF